MKTACPYHTREVHTWDDTPSFVAELKEQTRFLDILIIAFVPIVLIGLHFIPLSARETLAFNYRNPTIVTAYTSNFVHLNRIHLLGNIIGYLAIVPTAYVLSVLSNRRRHFLWNFAMVIIPCPFLISGTGLLFRSHGLALGFSGLAMALYGYASLVFVGYLATRLTTGLHLDHAPLIFFIQTTVISILVTRMSSMSYIVMRVSVVLAVIYLLWMLWSVVTSSEPLFSSEIYQTGYMETAFFALIVGSFLGSVGFSGGSVGAGDINVLVHIIGFTSGFTVSYVILRTDCSIAHVKHCAGPHGDCELHDSLLTRLLRWLLLAIRI